MELKHCDKDLYICMICKSKSLQIHEPKFSDNFTSWNVMSDGDGLCDFCQIITHEQKYRKSNWIIEDGNTVFFKREQILDFITKKKKTPFIIYLTETYKTLGYLNILSRPNFSNEKFIIAFDRDVIQVEKSKFEKFKKIALEAKEKKFSKTEMLNEPTVKHWEHESICVSIMNIKHDPLWKVVVFGI